MYPDWNERYSPHEYAYGREPNQFFKEWLLKLEPGMILMPADGEGRNGVFAALLEWKVTSFDQSIEGQKKALQLAEDHGVALEYLVGDLEKLEFKNEKFDAIGLIYAHFSAEKKSALHKKLNRYLRPGGILIFEAFSKNHLPLRESDPSVGGPNDIDMLFSKEEIIADFENYEQLLLEEKEITLNEGKYHIGKGSVIRFIGKKMG